MTLSFTRFYKFCLQAFFFKCNFEVIGRNVILISFACFFFFLRVEVVMRWTVIIRSLWYMYNLNWKYFMKNISTFLKQYLVFILGALVTWLLSTIVRLLSVHIGSVWKPSNSLLITHLCLSTATWSFATQPTHLPSVARNVHPVAVEGVKWAVTWLMACTCWRRAQSTWATRNETQMKVVWARVARD